MVHFLHAPARPPPEIKLKVETPVRGYSAARGDPNPTKEQEKQIVLLLLRYDTDTHQIDFYKSDASSTEEALSFTSCGTAPLAENTTFYNIPSAAFSHAPNELILIGRWGPSKGTFWQNGPVPTTILHLAPHFAPAVLQNCPPHPSNIVPEYSILAHQDMIITTTSLPGTSTPPIITSWHDGKAYILPYILFENNDTRVTSSFIFNGSDIRGDIPSFLKYVYCICRLDSDAPYHGSHETSIFIDIMRTSYFEKLANPGSANNQGFRWKRFQISARSTLPNHRISYSHHLSPVIVPCKKSGKSRLYIFGSFSESMAYPPPQEQAFGVCRLGCVWIDVLADGWIPGGPEVKATAATVPFGPGKASEFRVDCPVVAKVVEGKVWVWYTAADYGVRCAVATVDGEGGLVGWRSPGVRMPEAGGKGKAKFTVCFVTRGFL